MWIIVALSQTSIYMGKILLNIMSFITILVMMIRIEGVEISTTNTTS